MPGTARWCDRDALCEGADLRRRAVQPLAALEENEVLDLARACGGWAPLYGARQEWMQLSTTERVLVDAQYTDGYGELRDWQVYGQWGEDMLVVNRAGLLDSGTYWDGYALIPARPVLGWAHRGGPALPRGARAGRAGRSAGGLVITPAAPRFFKPGGPCGALPCAWCAAGCGKGRFSVRFSLHMGAKPSIITIYVFVSWGRSRALSGQCGHHRRGG